MYNRPSIYKDYKRDGMHDMICTMQSQFFIRDVNSVPTLFMVHTMRSNDVRYGFICSDLAWNCFVFEMLTTKYQLCDDSLVQIPEYMHDIGDVLICENLKSFSLSFRGEKIYEVDKKTGSIIRNTISGIPDFSLKKDCLQYLPYVVRINAQRHYAVSFIDDNGNGVWLETNEGDLAVWSPYSNLTISHDYSIYNKGVQKYDKFGSILYCILKPFVYNKICVNLAMKILHR